MLEFNSKPYFIYRNEMPPKRVRTVSDHSVEKFSPAYVDVVMSLDIETSHPDGVYDQGWIYSCQTNILTENWRNNSLRSYSSYLNCFRSEMELYDFLNQISEHYHLERGKRELLCYVHNLSFEAAWLHSDLEVCCGLHRTLWTKPHRCLEIRLENGIRLRDSLMLTQKNLKKTCEDNRAVHGKVDGYDHTLIRYPETPLSELEQSYIEADVLGLSESMYNFIRDRHYTLASVPMTSTGMNRQKVRKLLGGRGLPKAQTTDYGNKDPEVVEWIERLKKPFTLEEYEVMRRAYHGGHTAGNIYHYGEIIKDRPIEHYDFASSYPAVLLTEKEYCGQLHQMQGLKIEDLEGSSLAWMAILRLRNVCIRPECTMPCLPMAKLEQVVDGHYNNGKLLWCEECIHVCLHPDWECIRLCYCDFMEVEVLNCWVGEKEYLPTAFRKLIQQSFEDKTRLKGVEFPDDPEATERAAIDYAISKTQVNNWYGLQVEQLVRDEWVMDLPNHFKKIVPEDRAAMKVAFEKEWGNRTVRYIDGCMCTALAKRNLYRMMMCCGWDNVLYSDTDSVFGWADQDKIAAYNEECKRKIKESGFGYAENKDGKPSYIGTIDREDDYLSFRYLKAKAYCGETKKGFQLTLAGVPKKAGANHLISLGLDDAKKDSRFDDVDCSERRHMINYHAVRNFCEPLVFPSSTIGKLTTVFFPGGVNLRPVDYALSEQPALDRYFENQFELFEQWQEQIIE